MKPKTIRKDYKPMPNKLKYSEKLAKEICSLIEKGEHTINEVCSLSGITRKTFYKWKRERLQFPYLINKAENRKSEKLVCEAKRSMLKLLKGFDYVETKTQTKNMKNGSKKIIYTFSDKHVPADFSAIRFVLENCDKENFHSGLRRFITISFKKRRIKY